MLPPNQINPKLLKVLAEIQRTNPGASLNDILTMVKQDMSSMPNAGRGTTIFDYLDNQVSAPIKGGTIFDGQGSAPIKGGTIFDSQNNQEMPTSIGSQSRGTTIFDVPSNSSLYSISNIYKTPDDLGRAYTNKEVDLEQFNKIVKSMEEGTYGTSFPYLRTQKDIEEALNRGEISTEHYNNLYKDMSAKGTKFDILGVDEPADGMTEDGSNMDWMNLANNLMFLTPDLDPSAAFHHMGRAIGAPKGTKGRALTGIAAGLAGALDLGRTITSGIAYSKLNKEAQDWYNQQLQRRDYTPSPQSRDNNYLGGFSFEDGGQSGPPDGGSFSDNPDGIYTYKGTTYKKQGDKWLKDLTGKGQFVELTEGDIQSRYNELNKNALRSLDNYSLQFGENGNRIAIDTTGYSKGAGWGAFGTYPAIMYDREGNVNVDFPYNKEEVAKILDANRNIKKYEGGGENEPNQLEEGLYPFHPSFLSKYPGGGLQDMMQQQSPPPDNSGYEVGQSVTFEYGGKQVSGVIKKIENGKIYI